MGRGAFLLTDTKAIWWVTSSRMVRNVVLTRISEPPVFQAVSAASGDTRYTWRTDVMRSEFFWRCTAGQGGRGHQRGTS